MSGTNFMVTIKLVANLLKFLKYLTDYSGNNYTRLFNIKNNEEIVMEFQGLISVDARFCTMLNKARDVCPLRIL